MNQITHKNHYIPRSYLKNWSSDGKKVSVYSILVPNIKVPLWEDKSISNIAYVEDFYTLNVLGEEFDNIEKWLNTEFETPMQPVMEKIKNERRLTAEDWIILNKFVTAQYIRTPAHFYKLLQQWEKKMPDVIQKVLDKTIKVLEKQGAVSDSKTIDENIKPLPIKVNIDNENDTVTVKAIVGKELFLFELEHILKETVKILPKHQWHIIHPPDGLEWPTSDDPVIFLNFTNANDYDFDGGWNRKNGEILFPLTPKHLLYTQACNKRKTTPFEQSCEFSKLFIKLIVEHAHRYFLRKLQ
ncbi:MAG: DUF4238 domain-containing protein [Christensenellales bacterium]